MVSMLINNPRCNLNVKDQYGGTSLHLGAYLNTLKSTFFIYFLISSIRRRALSNSESLN